MNMKKVLLTGMTAALLSGCASYPSKVQMPLTDPLTGGYITGVDGLPVIVATRMSQKTMQAQQTTRLISQQLARENEQLTGTPDFNDAVLGCNGIQAPTGADNGVLYMAYLNAVSACVGAVANTGGGLTGEGLADMVAAARGESRNASARMFEETQKTQRAKDKLKHSYIALGLDTFLRVGELGLRAEELRNPSPSAGGNYVDGDVIVNQTQSNSGGVGAAAAAGGEEGDGAASGGGGQNRLAGMTIFGNTNGVIGTDNAKSTATGFGSSQFLETSATGVSTTNSTNKGLVTADENNGESTFNDDDLSPAVDF